MSKNKFLLSVASITFAAVTFTNIASSSAQSAFILGAGNAFSYGPGLSGAVNVMSVGATGPNSSVGLSTNTTSTLAENGGFASSGTGKFITGSGSADISNPASPTATVNTFNNQRTPNPLSRSGTFADTFGGQTQTVSPSGTPSSFAGFGYGTSF